ncbi:CHAT domain-containing tetratricopeptide repeat protein [Dokdonia sp.]|uniref:CHAT domain-containing protein n=1 Tax=Dokdonia sp. TaxID=2024995 RepID=UPI003264CA4D
MQSQNYFDTYNSLYANQGYTSKTKVDSLLTLCESSKNYKDYSTIASQFSIEIYKSNLKEAIHYGELALKKYPTSKVKDSIYATFRFRLGFFYSVTKEYDKSNELYLRIIEEGIDQARIAQSYSRLGLYYNVIGDYYKAEEYFKKGISILEELQDYSKLINNYNNLYLVYSNQGPKASLKSKKILDRILALESDGFITIKPSRKSDIYTRYADYYTQTETFDFEKARDYHFKNIELLKREGITHNNCSIYINLSDLYNIAKKDSANYYIQKTLKNCPQNAEYSYHHLSQYHRYRGDFDNALKAIQESLTISTGIKNTKTTTISSAKLKETKNKNYVFTAFVEKAHVLEQLYLINKDSNYLSLALDNILMADILIDIILEGSSEEKSQLHWRDRGSLLYIQGVRISNMLNKYDTAFYFIEKNKALILTSGISIKVKNKQLPDSIQKQEQELKKAILALETTITQTEDVTIQKEKHESLFHLKTQYQDLTDSITIAFPWYSKNTLKDHLTTIDEVRSGLDNTKAIISYIWGRNQDDDTESVYGMYIDTDITEIFEIENPDILKKNITQYRTAIAKPFETTSEQHKYQIAAQSLFNILIPSKTIKAAITHKELLIIPDGELQYIPFESFLLSKDPTDYFITSNKINYSYSLSFSKRNEVLQRKYDTEFTGFAPVQFSYDDLYSLPKSNLEISAIKKNIEGISFLEEMATKDNFLTKSNSSKIIHLATHADASSNPWIAFRNTKLQAHELYSYQNNAELVVLSACNTSVGDIAYGEGVMSLARGFFYAGANTVVSSLWETNDKVTAKIMDSFYSYIKEGDSKSDALYQAKLDYIHDSNLSKQSPYYWAPFILIGEADTSLYTSNTKTFYVLILIGIILIIFILYKKRKKIYFLGNK